MGDERCRALLEAQKVLMEGRREQAERDAWVCGFLLGACAASVVLVLVGFLVFAPAVLP